MPNIDSESRKEVLRLINYYNAIPPYYRTPELTEKINTLKKLYVDSILPEYPKEEKKSTIDKVKETYKQKVVKKPTKHAGTLPEMPKGRTWFSSDDRWWKKLDREIVGSLATSIGGIVKQAGGAIKHGAEVNPLLMDKLPIAKAMISTGKQAQEYSSQLREKGFKPEGAIGKTALYLGRGAVELAPVLPLITTMGLPAYSALSAAGETAAEGGTPEDVLTQLGIGGAQGALLHGALKVINQMNPKLARSVGAAIFGGMGYAAGEREPEKLAAEALLGLILSPGKRKKPEEIAKKVVEKYEEQVKLLPPAKIYVTPEGQTIPQTGVKIPPSRVPESRMIPAPHKTTPDKYTEPAKSKHLEAVAKEVKQRKAEKQAKEEKQTFKEFVESKGVSWEKVSGKNKDKELYDKLYSEYHGKAEKPLEQVAKEVKGKKEAKKKKQNVKIQNDILDSRRGETFGVIRAIDKNGKEIGRMEYSNYDGETAIKWIEVKPEHRRKGIATKMREKLKEEFKNDKIVTFGDYVTDEGQKFEKAVRKYQKKTNSGVDVSPKKQAEIPEFKNTEEAIEFGAKNKGNKELADRLRKEEQRLKEEIGKIKPSSEDNINKRMQIAFKKQLVREAREVMEGKMPPEPLPKKPLPVDKGKADVKPEIMSFEDYANTKGVSTTPPSFPEAHKKPGGASKASEKALNKRILKAMDDWQKELNKTREEYNRLVKEGKIREPSSTEELEQLAKLNTEQGKAAKRVLEKRKARIQSKSKAGAEVPTSKPLHKKAKEPWEMTREELRKKFEDETLPEIKKGLGGEGFYNTKAFTEYHKRQVEKALKQNKSVPESVLKDYPDLARRYKADLPGAETVKESSKATPAISKEAKPKQDVGSTPTAKTARTKPKTALEKAVENPKKETSEKAELSGKEYVKELAKAIEKDIKNKDLGIVHDPYKNLKDFIKKYRMRLNDREVSAIMNYYKTMSTVIQDKKKLQAELDSYLRKNYPQFAKATEPKKPAEKIAEQVKAQKEIKQEVKNNLKKETEFEIDGKKYKYKKETFDFDVHARVLEAVSKEMVAKGIKRDRENFPIFSDQIRDLIRRKVITIEEIKKKYEITEKEWYEYWRSEKGNWARALKRIKEAQDFVERELGLKLDKKTAEELTKITAWDWLVITAKRLDNIRRGIAVSQFSTAIRNAYGQTVRIIIDVPDEMMRIAFGKLLRMPEFERAKILDGLKLLENIGKKNSKVVEKMLEKSPHLIDDIYRRYASDILKGTKAGKILSKAEKTVEVLNWANILQEYTLRNAAFIGKIEARLAQRGIDIRKEVKAYREYTKILKNKYGKKYLEKMTAEEKAKLEKIAIEFNDKIKVKDLKAAIKYALEMTWADNPRSRIARDVLRIVNSFPFMPWGTGGFPFMRFTMLSTRFVYEHSPFGLLSLAKIGLKGEKIDPVIISKAITGTLMLGTAYLIRNSEYGGERWNEIKVGDKYYDVRFIYPFASYLFMADVAKRIKDGTLERMSVKDWLNGLFSVNVRAGFGAYAIDEFANALLNHKSAKSAWNYFKDYVGQIGASYLTWLNMINDFTAGLDETAAEIKYTKLKWTAPIKEKIPVLREELPAKYKPTSSKPVTKKYPWLKLFTGVIRKDDKNLLEKEVDRLGLTYPEIYPNLGDRKLNYEVVKKIGAVLEDKLIPVLRSKKYKDASDARKAYFLNQAFKEVKKIIKEQVLGGDEELLKLYKDVRFQRLPLRKRRVLEEIIKTRREQ